MLAALGSLASWAVPQLLTFASKKILGSNVGTAVSKTLRNPQIKGVLKNIGTNYKRMMTNQYDRSADPQQNAKAGSKNINWQQYQKQQEKEEDWQDQQQAPPPPPPPKKKRIVKGRVRNK